VNSSKRVARVDAVVGEVDAVKSHRIDRCAAFPGFSALLAATGEMVVVQSHEVGRIDGFSAF
jgi:hypothetical protein